jgi:transposase
MHISARTKYKVVLTPEEKASLQTIIHKGTAKARTITRVRVLLLVDEGKTDKDIYMLLHTATSTPHDIRKKYHEGKLKRALFDAPRPGKERKLNGKQEARVVAIACSKAPKGYTRWTLDLLTEEVNNQGIVIGRTPVWKVLLRNKTKPWLKKNVVYSESDT